MIMHGLIRADLLSEWDNVKPPASDLLQTDKTDPQGSQDGAWISNIRSAVYALAGVCL